ncbi:MAG: cyclase family protein [Acidimicrobiales bacterium]|nr:cyclase family protein [Acidimicrobiales bacterium]
MSDELATTTRPKRLRKLAAGSAVMVGMLAVGTAAGAHYGTYFGSNRGNAANMSCPGGMARLSQVFDESASIFPGDPPPVIDVVFTVGTDGFLLEEVTTGTHTGTHLDAPAHFHEGAVTVDDLTAEQLVFTPYVIDVRDRVAAATTVEEAAFQLTWDEIREYERRNGRIPAGSMVILFTGFQYLFGTEAYLGDAPGFAPEAVQRLFDERGAKGVGSDTFGPDATTDEDYLATETALANGGVVLTNLANLDVLHVTGDLIMSPAVRLRDGSGYQVDVLACLGRGRERS